MKISKNKLRLHRKKRVRAKVKGVSEKPRMSVFRSLKNVSIQIINDEKGYTLASASLAEIKGKNNLESSQKLGKLIAKKCADKKIKEVVFDRSGYRYHGKIKNLAEGAREGGLKF